MSKVVLFLVALCLTATSCGNDNLSPIGIDKEQISDGDGGADQDDQGTDESDGKDDGGSGEVLSFADLLSVSDFGASGSYKDVTYVSKISGAEYAGHLMSNFTGEVSRFQIRSKNDNSGIVITKSEHKIARIKFIGVSSTNGFDVYGSSTPYHSAKDLYSDSSCGQLIQGSIHTDMTIDFNDAQSYRYIGIRSCNGATYIENIEIVYGQVKEGDGGDSGDSDDNTDDSGDGSDQGDSDSGDGGSQGSDDDSEQGSQGETRSDKADWWELPAVNTSVTTAKEYTFTAASQRNYTAFYDTKTYSSLWIAYPINSSHIGGSRSGSWKATPGIPTDEQINIWSGSYGVNYAAGNIYSRGHQIPDGDRSGVSAMQSQTYYAVNSTPQIQNNFNGGIWNQLENAIRGIQSSTTMYIATGPVYQTIGGSESVKNIKPAKDNKQCPVPNYYWKALLKVKLDSKGQPTSACTIGFWFSHIPYSNGDYEKCAMSVDEIEKKIGFNLFANLPDSVEAASEKNSSWSSFKSF